MSRDRIEKIVFLPRNVHFDSKYLVLSQSLMNSQTCKDSFSASLKVSEIRIRRAFHELELSTIISLFFAFSQRPCSVFFDWFEETVTTCLSLWQKIVIMRFLFSVQVIEKAQKKAQFSFCGQRKAFRYRLFFEEFNLIFFTAERLACSEMQPRQRRFGEFGGTLFTLWSRKLRF